MSIYHQPSRRIMAFLIATGVYLACHGMALAQETNLPLVQIRTLLIDHFYIRFEGPGSGVRTGRMLHSVMNRPFILVDTFSGYEPPSWRGIGHPVTLTLEEINRRYPARYSTRALQHILVTIRNVLQEEGLGRFGVIPDPTQISSTGADLRTHGQRDVTLIVKISDAPEIPLEATPFPVDRIDLRFASPHSEWPSLDAILDVPFSLVQTSRGYVDPTQVAEGTLVTLTLAEIEHRPVERYYPLALRHIQTIIVSELMRTEGLMGVGVLADPQQITPTNPPVDLRQEGEADLTFLIFPGIVTELRTLGGGDRVDDQSDILPGQRINHPVHEFIRSGSPLQPYTGEAQTRGDILRNNDLENYLSLLSRHPGRTVTANISAGPGTGYVQKGFGSTTLDFQVTENNPQVLYMGMENTGNDSTDRLRSKFGWIDTQFSDRDDILSIEYTTAPRGEVASLVASYDAPLDALGRTRWRVFGNWNEYTAAEVGFFGEDFIGSTWVLGGEMSRNLHQHRDTFIDVYGGARFEQVRVRNQGGIFPGLASSAEEEFLTFTIGARSSKLDPVLFSSTTASISLDIQEGSLTGVDEADVEGLGRTSPASSWTILRGSVERSFYLEPLNILAFQDPSSPSSSTLAREIYLALRGQSSLDSRLIPQAEMTIGGFHSVRGYPEAALVGDNVITGTAEFRYHLPRTFAIEPTPQERFGEPFRFAPQHVFGYPDWDLVFKCFLDAGRSNITSPLSFEKSESLLGAGVGVDLVWQRNMRIQVDWGFALEGMEGLGVEKGSNRIHFLATFMF